ncbi:hypothetical protein [Clostridioides sp. ZZV15-6598]|uniref:hypothetical protein n=1 Tax=Clostridioides sp. ZZV15-6598 TaxID=2811501 RepID=UPI001D1105B5|nr:hypothetical protein [Clostridioides sp. ZZV15-6598]
MDIKVVEIFPTNPVALKKIEAAKAKWLVNVLRKKYPEEVLDKAFKILEEDLEKSEAKD